MDAPNAFHEAFVCAVLVLEAAQAGGVRGHHPLRVGLECVKKQNKICVCWFG